MINNNCHRANVIGSNFILKSFFFPQDLYEIAVNKRCFDFPHRHSDANHTGVSFYWAMGIA